MFKNKQNFRNLDISDERQTQSSEASSGMLLVHILLLLHNPNI